jgi:hypothetical protein
MFLWAFIGIIIAAVLNLGLVFSKASLSTSRESSRNVGARMVVYHDAATAYAKANNLPACSATTLTVPAGYLPQGFTAGGWTTVQGMQAGHCQIVTYLATGGTVSGVSQQDVITQVMSANRGQPRAGIVQSNAIAVSYTTNAAGAIGNGSMSVLSSVPNGAIALATNIN